MPVESQTDFSGGLNDRYPPHKIEANQCAALSNVDLSFGDLRGEYQTASGGQADYYYEKAGTWVSAGGFTPTIPISTFSSSTTTISTNTNYYSVVDITDTHTVTIGNNITVELYESTQGVYSASAFVEYNEDLYVARDEFTVTGTWDHTDTGNENRITTTVAKNLQVGDGLAAANIPSDVFITLVDAANDHVYINKNMNSLNFQIYHVMLLSL